MKKNMYVFLLCSIIVFVFISCSSSNFQFKTERNISREIYDYNKAFNFIKQDSVFIKDIKKYFPDLNDCKTLEFFQSELIEPITLSFFDKKILTKTKYFENYKDLDILSFKKIKAEYDLKSKFTPYLINLKTSNINLKESCLIKLSFSKRKNNIQVIKYSIHDVNIDPRINYKPREGFYLFEYDRKGNILQNFYVLKSS